MSINAAIVFIATDEMGATSRYEPQIEICSCINEGICTINGILNQMANPIELNCLCTEGKDHSQNRYFWLSKCTC